MQLKTRQVTLQDRNSLKFDIATSASGIVRITTGRGRTEARRARERQWAAEARRQLKQYLAGQRSYFSVPLDLSNLTPFQRTVLRLVQDIPFGETRAYGWVAEKIGRPGAARAVGQALGANPLPFLIPCHRVLRSDGSLGGYAFGLELKAGLLRLEKETAPLIGCAAKDVSVSAAPHAAIRWFLPR